MPRDPYENQDDITAPAVKATEVSLASDTVFTKPYPRGIWVGGAGNIVLALSGEPGVYRTIVGVQAGTMLALRPETIRSTANLTTATDIVVLY